MASPTPRKPKRQPSSPSLAVIVKSWKLSLEARNKSARTVEQYTDSARLFVEFLERKHLPTQVASITREHVESFMVDQLARLKPSSAQTRYKCLKLLFDWCEEEEELERSPMAKMKPPIIPEQPVPVLTDLELVKLFKVCQGRGFEERRDLAIISLLADTGIRRAECAGLDLDDVDLDHKMATVLGKGRRPRTVTFGKDTALAVSRWLRSRDTHRLADEPDLWLGTQGRRFSDQGLRQMLERRGEQAGVANVHAHRLRHTFAHNHLANGGNEGDLMSLAGWRSRQMLTRYASSTAGARARDAYQSPVDRLNGRKPRR